MDTRIQLLLKNIKRDSGTILDIGNMLTESEKELIVSQGFFCEAISFNINNLEKYIKKGLFSNDIVAVCFLDLPAHIDNKEEWGREISEILSGNDAVLYFQDRNEDSKKTFEKIFAKNNIILRKCNLLPQNMDGDLDNTLFLEGTLVNQYLRWLNSVTGIVEFDDVYVGICNDKNARVLSNNEQKVSPFLSVITRTQGRRPESLRETLLCLSAQTDDDFEVILIGHKLSNKQEELVRDIIEDTPISLRKKIRFIKLDKGNRTAPINEGFRNARGKYAIILDDDDIVFDNWVEEFKIQYEKTPGAVLHAYAISQDWMTVDTDIEDKALRACGSPKSDFCKKFNWLTELYGNTCPPVGLAFPTYPFKKWNIEFDETLDTTEDWDYLMRVGFLCGVSDIEKPTCIYRLWVNAESSQTVHSKELWIENHKRIQKKFEQIPIVLPKGYSKNINMFIKSKGAVADGDCDDGVMLGEECPLYLDFGKGFSEKNVIRETGIVNDGEFEYVYILPDKKVNRFRWDPTENKDKLLEKLAIKFEDIDGNICKVSKNRIRTNGVKVNEQICFYKKDPQVIFECVGHRKYAKVIITGIIRGEIPDEYFDKIVGGSWKGLIKKCLKKIYHKVRG